MMYKQNQRDKVEFEYFYHFIYLYIILISLCYSVNDVLNFLLIAVFFGMHIFFTHNY